MMSDAEKEIAKQVNAKRQALSRKVNEVSSNAVKDLTTLLDIKDGAQKTDAIAKIFSKNLDAVVKATSDNTKAQLEKAIDQRVAAIVGKVDTDGDGRINFEGDTFKKKIYSVFKHTTSTSLIYDILFTEFKKVVLNEDTQDFFEQQLDLGSLFKR